MGGLSQKTIFFQNFCLYYLGGHAKFQISTICPYWAVTTTREKFTLAPMGVLAPRSVHARPSAQPPIDASGNFLARMSAGWPSNISPNP